MEISKNSWMYKVAYGLNETRKQPDTGNLCRFFWKFMLMLFIVWPLVIIAVGLFTGITYLIGFFFAARPRIFKGDPSNPDAPMRFYQNWPRVKGFRVLPIYFVLLGSLTFVPWGKLLKLLQLISWGKLSIVLIVCAAVVLIIGGAATFLESETCQLLNNYLAAKKAKVCPRITFTNKKK